MIRHHPDGSYYLADLYRLPDETWDHARARAQAAFKHSEPLPKPMEVYDFMDFGNEAEEALEIERDEMAMTTDQQDYWHNGPLTRI